MFEVAECHFEVILCYLSNRKCKFFQVEKSDDSNGRMALESHCLPLDKPKFRLWRGRENDISSGRQALGTHFLPLNHPKMLLG